MTERTSRRWFLGATVAVGGLAGCIGGDGNADSDTGGTDGDRAGGGFDGGSGGDGWTGDEETPTPVDRSTPEDSQTPEETPEDDRDYVLSDYQFSEGESYTYDSYAFGRDTTGSWSVLDVDGGEMTVAVEIKGDEGTRSDEHHGAQNSFFEGMKGRTGDMVFGTLRSLRMLVGDHSLEQGEEWTTPTADAAVGSFGWEFEEVTLEVTGTNSYAGVECTTIEMRNAANGQPFGELCIDPDLAYPVWSVAYGDGEKTWEFTLTDYSEGSG